MSKADLNRADFTNYLLSVGLRSNGAAEVLQRIEEDRPDQMDLTHLRLYEKALIARGEN